MGKARLPSLVLAAAAAFCGGDALAGAQQYEVLSASVRASLSALSFSCCNAKARRCVRPKK